MLSFIYSLFYIILNHTYYMYIFIDIHIDIPKIYVIKHFKCSHLLLIILILQKIYLTYLHIQYFTYFHTNFQY